MAYLLDSCAPWNRLPKRTPLRNAGIGRKHSNVWRLPVEPDWISVQPTNDSAALNSAGEIYRLVKDDGTETQSTCVHIEVTDLDGSTWRISAEPLVAADKTQHIRARSP